MVHGSGRSGKGESTPDQGRDWIIEVREATIRFGRMTAVDRVSLVVGHGEVFGLLGPNGAGKTTLIRALCGLIPLALGSARVLGHDATRESEAVRAGIGYMSQRFALYEDLTAQENLDFYSGVYGLSSSRARQRQAELVDRVGLAPHLRKRGGQLSGGWKQRLALACALLHQPRLVFLDEPTAGIDPVARRDLWDRLFQLAAEDVTLFVTTHYMDEAERCGRVGYLYQGRLLAIGTPLELTRLPGVTPSGTRRVEIIGADPAALLLRVHTLPGVHQATIFGRPLRAVVDGSLTDEALGARLGGAEIRPAAPSLEDVFVALARAQESHPQGDPR
jgi:ABC-type multidrug transport system ATPase subunit